MPEDPRLEKLDGKVDTLLTEVGKMKSDLAVVTAGIPNTEIRLSDHDRRIRDLEVQTVPRAEVISTHRDMEKAWQEAIASITSTTRWAIGLTATSLVGVLGLLVKIFWP